jgi:hypothetical protein
MVIGVAIVANACSFLLPTANITSLLVMANAGAGSGSFVATAWPSWLAVTVLTVTLMTLLVRAVPSRGGAPFVRRTSGRCPGSASTSWACSSWQPRSVCCSQGDGRCRPDRLKQRRLAVC